MSKTQVLKLNTAKDNVQNFFNKMKSKILQNQFKLGNQENYDITMIVKHQNKKNEEKDEETGFLNKQSTRKSILSQNNQFINVPKSNQSQKFKSKPIIYDQQMHMQKGILYTQKSSFLSKQQELVKYNKENNNSNKVNRSNKIRQSNKIPSIGALFHFNKKKDQKDQIFQESINQNSNKNKKSVFSISCSTDKKFSRNKKDKERQVNFQQKSNQQDQSQESNASQTSSIQQIQEEQLRKHVSRRHIDIFPNIEIDSVMSQKLMSSKNFLFGQSKKHINRINHRRCSISDENLLSPRAKSKYQIDSYNHSKKNINASKSQTHVFMKDNIIQKLNDDRQFQNEQKKNKKRASLKLSKVNQEQSSDVQNSNEIQEFPEIENNKKTKKTRDSVLAKHSIFQQSKNAQKSQLSKRMISFRSSNFSDNAYDKQNISINLLNQSSSVPNPQHLALLNSEEIKERSETQSSSSELSREDQKSETSSNQQPEDSIYVIQNKLNDCLKLLEKNQLSSLQDFLYQFKDKYFYVSNTRIQIKWRLMMAHCKQNKKQYERAAINYNNVIDMAKDNPKSLVIQPAQVYQRLGVCYSEIRWWNKGILAFAEALNRYKRNKNSLKYSECMNNLGTLYLQAQSISLAQKCFIQSYDLKKFLYGKNSTKLLTSLFNIFQCNLLMKNYDQAEKVILVIEQQIINKIPETQISQLLYMGGLSRRKGKMQFLRGNLLKAQQYFMKSYQKLANKYPYCMEFGQLMSCLGLLKLQDKKYKQSKQYYDKAIMLMNFYCSKDSKTILTLKKNLEYSVKMIKQERQGFSSRKDTN